MRSSAIAEELPFFFADKMSVFIKGPVGAGKSSIVHQVGARLKMEVRDTVRASQMDPTDIKGFPAPDAKKNAMRWLPPNFLPTDPKSKGILFLDELTSGPVAVQAACYQLMLDRKVGEYELPEGWAIVAAGNREIDRSIVNRMPAALANRMVHIDYEVHIDDFAAWGMNRLDPRTIAFLRFRDALLHNFAPDSKEAAFPTPRTWEFADKIMQRFRPAARTMELLKGTVGSGAAAEYSAFWQMASQLPDRDQIALDPLNTEVPTLQSARYAVATMLSSATKAVDAFRTYMKYVERLPVEFQVVYIRDMLEKKDTVDVRQTKEWTQWAMKNRDVVL